MLSPSMTKIYFLRLNFFSPLYNEVVYGHLCFVTNGTQNSSSEVITPHFWGKKWGHRISNIFHVFLMDSPLSVTISYLRHCLKKCYFEAIKFTLWIFLDRQGQKIQKSVGEAGKCIFFWLDISWCMVSWLLRVLLASRGLRYQPSRTYAYPQCSQF